MEINKKEEGGKVDELMLHRGHDGVPRRCEDVRVVVALVVTFQLSGEILSG